MHSRLLCLITITLALLGGATPSYALDSNWTISGQVRPRFEYRNGYRNLPVPNSEPAVFVSQRTRLGVSYRAEPRARFTIVVQDVRTWGDELSTADASADNIDVHIANVELTPRESITIQVGRQEYSYDEDRILGPTDWRQHGRVHDAVRLKLHSGHTDVHVAVSHHEQGEPTSSASYFNTDNYEDMLLLWGSTQSGGLHASALALYDSYDRTYRILIQDRWTLGGRLELKGIPFSGRVEGYYQMGRHKTFTQQGYGDWTRIQRDLGAYLAALSLTLASERRSFTLWYDYLSGDKDANDGDYGVFDVPYGSNHKSYGWADLFIRMPEDTKDHGLQDLAAKSQFREVGPLTIDCHLHYFALSQDDDQGKRGLGFEADVMATAVIMPNVKLQAGYSLVLPSDALKRLKGGSDDGHWFWTMLDFNVK